MNEPVIRGWRNHSFIKVTKPKMGRTVIITIITYQPELLEKKSQKSECGRMTKNIQLFQKS